jgi:nicotinate-nucleotide pyrophosphorylase
MKGRCRQRCLQRHANRAGRGIQGCAQSMQADADACRGQSGRQATIPGVPGTGVDRLSTGDLTKDTQATNYSMRFPD